MRHNNGVAMGVKPHRTDTVVRQAARAARRRRNNLMRVTETKPFHGGL
jgi:hypothetical protein